VICYECGYVEGSNNIPQYLPPSNLSNIREYQPSEYALRFVAIAEEMFEQNEGIINPFQYKYSWCAAFIGKCADAAGIASDVIPRSNGCTQIYNNLLKQGGQIVTNPMAGDLIFYKSLDTENAYSHIGIMLSETTSIQGNVGSQIKKLKKPTDYYYHYPDRRSTSGDIVYVRPNY
jgi:hypothetical protein